MLPRPQPHPFESSYVCVTWLIQSTWNLCVNVILCVCIWCRLWDPSRKQCVTTWNTGAVTNSLSFSLDHNLALSSHPDATLRIWDFRLKPGTSSSQPLESRATTSFRAKGWLTSAKWMPINENSSRTHQFVSCDHTGAVQVWDLRSKVALHTMGAHEDKALALAWWPSSQLDSIRLLSGGADSQVRVYSVGDR